MSAANRKQTVLIIVAFIAGNINAWLLYNNLVEKRLMQTLSYAYAYKGMVSYESEQIKESIENYHASHLYHRLNYDPLLGLAQAYSKAECNKLAIDYYSTTLQLLSDNNASRVDRYIAQKELAYILFKQEKYKEAMEFLLVLEEEYEVENEILYYIGLSYNKLNNLSASRKYLELYLSKAEGGNESEMNKTAIDIIGKYQ